MKRKVIKLLIKWGNNESSVNSMIDANYSYAVSTYPDTTPAFIANVINTLRQMIEYKIQLVHKDNILAGDAIEHNGKIMTVCNCDFRFGFMGLTIFGDSYCLGRKLVKKVVIKKCRD